MRALALTVVAGCVIPAPEGAPQTWAPELGITVEAVVAGDLDANGSTEIVVVGSGEDNQAGMYLLQGGRDLVFNSGGTTVRSFTRFVPAEIEPPVATYYAGGAAPRVYLAQGSDVVRVTRLTNTLAEEADGASTIAAGGALLWTRPVMFPGNMPHIAVSNGSTIDHLTIDLADPRPIPAPMSPTWNLAQLATSYTNGAETVVVVATPDAIRRAPIPTMPGAPFAYETVRMDPAKTWLGQTAFDFDNDGREEIVGFDLMAHDVCVIDPGAPIGTLPSCVHLTSTFPGNDVTLIVGSNISPNALPDILVAQTNATETTYSIVEDFTYAAGILTAAMVRTIPVMGPPRGRTVLANAGPGTPNVALTFGIDGTVACVLGPC